MTAVTVKVLGGFGFVVDERRVPELSRRDAARLAKLLALTPGRRMHREVLLDVLWPEADPASGANRLHKAAHFVRRASGRVDGVVLDGTTVALFPDADVTVDAAEFERLAGEALATGDREALRRAADAYAR